MVAATVGVGAVSVVASYSRTRLVAVVHFSQKILHTSRFGFGITFPKIYISVIYFFLEFVSQKLHYMYSFVIQIITWKFYLGIIF